jgi:hypothetical protein
LREEHRLRVFENGVLREIFGPRRDEVTGEWRRLHNEERCNLYCSPNIIRVIKSRRMKLAGQVELMGESRGAYRVFVGDLRERHYLEDHLGVNWRIILKLIFKNWDGESWTGLIWLRTIVNAVTNRRVP